MYKKNMFLVKATLAFIIASILLVGCIENTSNEEALIIQPEKIQIKIDDTVYICTGSMSYAYHLNKDCTGLGKCHSGIVLMDKNEAVEKEQRQLCGFEK